MALSRSLKDLMQRGGMQRGGMRSGQMQRPVMKSPRSPQGGFGSRAPRKSKPVTARDSAMRPRTSKPVTAARGSAFGFMDRGKRQPGFGAPKPGMMQQQPTHRRQFGAMQRPGRSMGRYMR